MGTEARVGVVAGLVIVVIASVYFFYGSTPGEDELLVATATRVTEPPKIPESAEKKIEPVPADRPGALVNRPTADSQRQVAQRPVQRPPQRLAERLATGPRSPTDATLPARPTDTTTGRPSGTPIVLADPSRSEGARPQESSQPISLRTSPSPELVEATWDKLLKPDEKATDPHGTDYSTIGDRIRTAVASNDSAEEDRPLPRDPSRSVNPSAERAEPEAASDVRKDLQRSRAAEERLPIVTMPTATNAPENKRSAFQPSDRLATGPAARSASVGGWPKQHVISEGDTLEGISQKYYQVRTASDDILAANPQIKGPRQLRIGDTLTIPQPRSSNPPATDSAAAARSIPGTGDTAPTPVGRTYRVVEGDTLYGIAQKQLGSGARWEEILRLNKALLKGDPRRLSPGMTLRLPES